MKILYGNKYTIKFQKIFLWFPKDNATHNDSEIMAMKNEWFAAKDLTNIVGLPSSTQGINLMARREGWISCRRKGV